jgi:hypothetical protein
MITVGAQKKLMIGRGEGEAIFRGSIRFGFFFFCYGICSGYWDSVCGRDGFRVFFIDGVGGSYCWMGGQTCVELGGCSNISAVTQRRLKSLRQQLL